MSFFTLWHKYYLNLRALLHIPNYSKPFLNGHTKKRLLKRSQPILLYTIIELDGP